MPVYAGAGTTVLYQSDSDFSSVDDDDETAWGHEIDPLVALEVAAACSGTLPDLPLQLRPSVVAPLPPAMAPLLPVRPLLEMSLSTSVDPNLAAVRDRMKFTADAAAASGGGVVHGLGPRVRAAVADTPSIAYYSQQRRSVLDESPIDPAAVFASVRTILKQREGVRRRRTGREKKVIYVPRVGAVPRVSTRGANSKRTSRHATGSSAGRAEMFWVCWWVVLASVKIRCKWQRARVARTKEKKEIPFFTDHQANKLRSMVQGCIRDEKFASEKAVRHARLGQRALNRGHVDIPKIPGPIATQQIYIERAKKKKRPPSPSPSCASRASRATTPPPQETPTSTPPPQRDVTPPSMALGVGPSGRGRPSLVVLPEATLEGNLTMLRAVGNLKRRLSRKGSSMARKKSPSVRTSPVIGPSGYPERISLLTGENTACHPAILEHCPTEAELAVYHRELRALKDIGDRAIYAQQRRSVSSLATLLSTRNSSLAIPGVHPDARLLGGAMSVDPSAGTGMQIAVPNTLGYAPTIGEFMSPHSGPDPPYGGGGCESVSQSPNSSRRSTRRASLPRVEFVHQTAGHVVSPPDHPQQPTTQMHLSLIAQSLSPPAAPGGSGGVGVLSPPVTSAATPRGDGGLARRPRPRTLVLSQPHGDGAATCDPPSPERDAARGPTAPVPHAPPLKVSTPPPRALIHDVPPPPAPPSGRMRNELEDEPSEAPPAGAGAHLASGPAPPPRRVPVLQGLHVPGLLSRGALSLTSADDGRQLVAGFWVTAPRGEDEAAPPPPPPPTTGPRKPRVYKRTGPAPHHQHRHARRVGPVAVDGGAAADGGAPWSSDAQSCCGSGSGDAEAVAVETTSPCVLEVVIPQLVPTFPERAGEDRPTSQKPQAEPSPTEIPLALEPPPVPAAPAAPDAPADISTASLVFKGRPTPRAPPVPPSAPPQPRQRDATGASPPFAGRSRVSPAFAPSSPVPPRRSPTITDAMPNGHVRHGDRGSVTSFAGNWIQHIRWGGGPEGGAAAGHRHHHHHSHAQSVESSPRASHSVSPRGSLRHTARSGRGRAAHRFSNASNQSTRPSEVPKPHIPHAGLLRMTSVCQDSRVKLEENYAANAELLPKYKPQVQAPDVAMVPDAGVDIRQHYSNFKASLKAEDYAFNERVKDELLRLRREREKGAPRLYRCLLNQPIDVTVPTRAITKAKAAIMTEALQNSQHRKAQIDLDWFRSFSATLLYAPGVTPDERVQHVLRIMDYYIGVSKLTEPAFGYLVKALDSVGSMVSYDVQFTLRAAAHVFGVSEESFEKMLKRHQIPMLAQPATQDYVESSFLKRARIAESNVALTLNMERKFLQLAKAHDDEDERRARAAKRGYVAAMHRAQRLTALSESVVCPPHARTLRSYVGKVGSTTTSPDTTVADGSHTQVPASIRSVARRSPVSLPIVA